MIKRCTILFLVLFYCTDAVKSQTYFSNRYPVVDGWGGVGFNATENNSGYLTVGVYISLSTGKQNLRLIQTDFNGNVFFEKIYGDTIFSYGIGFQGSLQKVNSSGYIMFGAKQDINGLYDVLYRFNDAGDTLWTKQIADTTYDYVGDNMKETPDGGFICIGDRGSPSAPISIIKTDSLGNKQWEQFYGGTTYDKPTSIAVCSDGGYIYCTTTKSGGVGLPTYYNIRVMKIDSLGNMVFNKFFGGTLDDGAGSIIQTQDGGYVFCGSSKSDIDNRTRPYIIRLDNLGDTLWTKTYTPPSASGSSNNFSTILELNDGSFIAAGQERYTDSIAISRYHGLIVKTTSTGDLVWSREHNLSTCNTCSSYLYDIRTTSDGGFICSGVANSPQDMWLLKLDSLGCADTVCALGTSIEAPKSPKGTFSVYPNPAHSLITVELQQLTTEFTFSLIDLTGKEILTKQINLPYTKINVQHLAKGIYFYQITGEKERYSGKLVVQ